VSCKNFLLAIVWEVFIKNYLAKLSALTKCKSRYEIKSILER